MNFGFPTNYAQSQVSSSTTQYDSNFSGVENGGLFSKEECRNLARYIKNNKGKLLKPTMGTMMGFVRLLKLQNGWSIATEP